MTLTKVTVSVEPYFSGDGYSWGGGAILCFETNNGLSLAVRFGEGSESHKLAREIQIGLQAIIDGRSERRSEK